MARDRREVRVVVKKRCARANNRHRDQTITQTSERFPSVATCTVDCTRLLEVGQTIERQDLEAKQS